MFIANEQEAASIAAGTKWVLNQQNSETQALFGIHDDKIQYMVDN